MTEDQLLLQRYVRDAAPEALGELARRYRDLVYSSAMRQVRDPHLAEDVTQAVFIVLSKKAGTIRQVVALGGWLLAVTRRASLNAMKKQAIQHRHERAAAKTEAVEEAAANWDQVDPVLDAMMSRLSRTDRDAVVLRFFQEQSFAQVGAELGLTEDAARKRVGRALERLRGLLNRRGVHLGAAALGTAIAAHATEASPMRVAWQVAVSKSSTEIAKDVATMMIISKAKFLSALVVLMLLVAGGVTFVALSLAQQTLPARAQGVTKPPAILNAQTIRGTWRIISMISDGKPSPQEELNAGRIVIDDSSFLIVSRQPNVPRAVQRVQRNTYTLDASKEPGWFDMTMSERPLKLSGLYEVNGDELRIAMKAGADRATEMASAVGSGVSLWTLERVKPTPRPLVETDASTIEGFARQFIAGISSDGIDGVAGMFVTPEEINRMFEGPNLDQVQKQLAAERFPAVLNMAEELKDARFVGIGGGSGGVEQSAPVGQRFGPLRTKVAVQITDNLRVNIDLLGVEREIKLDSLIKIDDHWRLLTPPSLKKL